MTKYVPTTTQAADVNELRRYTLGELYRVSASLATVEATGNAVEVVAALPTTGNYEGRVVYLTTDDKLYTHNGTTWSIVANNYVVSGSSIMTYAQATAPTSPNVGDIWFDTSTTANTPKRWDGTAWVSLADARVAANAAAIVTEQIVRSDADNALASNITNLAAVVSTNNSTQSAAIANEQTVRANADNALASSITSLTATVNTNNTNVNARITTEETTRANADTALASSVSTLTATVNTNKSEATAAITNEQTVRASADTALASSISSLTTTVTNNNNTLTAAVNNEQTARIAGDNALAAQITQLIVSGGAAIMTYAQSSAPANPNIGDVWFDTSTTANVPKRWNGTTWEALSDARVALNAAAITTEQSARISADSALATDITNLSAVVSSNYSTQQAAISNEQTARANADSALSSSLSALTATVNTNNTNVNAAISAEQTARANADTALATRATNLEATVNSATLGNSALQSRIATEESARASGDATNASSITSLTSTVNGQAASITTLQTTSASLQSDVTNLNAQYGVTVSAGKVTGFKLNSSATTSDFIVQADRFKVENATGVPFEVVGGVTYLKEAMINTLSANKITTGTLSTSRLSIDGLTLTNSSGTLKIGDAGVNTGQIAGGAVSAVNYAIGGGGTVGTSWTVIQTLTISLSETSTVLLTGASDMYVYSASTVAEGHGVMMSIIKSGETPSDLTYDNATGTYFNYRRGLSLRRVRVLAAGTHTFQLVAQRENPSNPASPAPYVNASNPYLEATVLKR